ncbi:uncharacterized protein [Primulina huaijiensis]|uniref:uncharacterized protein n=1 Tax=Primulina huaijiensis TaxID=1492673 RepID=UPI003CC756BC
MVKYGGMAADKTDSASSTISSSEGTSLVVTGHKLNGHNFLQWSQSVMMFICGKGKDEYLTGSITQPKSDDPKFKAWKTENNMVMSWLINSMTNEIGENFLLYGTTQEIWEAAKETYSNNENTSELFEIETILHDLRQDDLNVTQYYNTLNRHWQHLDLFEANEWKYVEDEARYKDIISKKRVFKFLLGLNKNLDEVRGRMLAIKPLPTIREVFSEVRREESRRKVMLGSTTSSLTTEISAMVSYGSENNSSDGQYRKARPWCDHCKRTGHTRESCWKIHGNQLIGSQEVVLTHRPQPMTITQQSI